MKLFGEISKRKKIFFELEDVKNCEERKKFNEDGRGNGLETVNYYAILKTGEELLLNIGVYNEIMKHKKF